MFDRVLDRAQLGGDGAKRLVNLVLQTLQDGDALTLTKRLVRLQAAGKVPPIFQSAARRGRGSDPILAEYAEVAAWIWIWLEHARTRERIEDLKARVANAVGVTPAAVEKWREAWTRRDGADAVKNRRKGIEKAVTRWHEIRVGPPHDPEAELARIVAQWKAGRRPVKARARQREPK
jgi:hypothetical protein